MTQRPGRRRRSRRPAGPSNRSRKYYCCCCRAPVSLAVATTGSDQPAQPPVRASLEATFPAGFPVNSEKSAGANIPGTICKAFGSPRDAELRPASLRFPRGRYPRHMRPGALPRFPDPSPLVVAVSSPSRVAWARSPPPPPMRPPPPPSCPRGRPPPRHQHLRLRRLVCLYLHISSPNSTANEIPTAAVVDPPPPPPSSPLLCLICELGPPFCLLSPASSLPPSSPCSLGFLLTSTHIDS